MAIAILRDNGISQYRDIHERNFVAKMFAEIQSADTSRIQNALREIDEMTKQYDDGRYFRIYFLNMLRHYCFKALGDFVNAQKYLFRVIVRTNSLVAHAEMVRLLCQTQCYEAALSHAKLLTLIGDTAQDWALLAEVNIFIGKEENLDKAVLFARKAVYRGKGGNENYKDYGVLAKAYMARYAMKKNTIDIESAESSARQAVAFGGGKIAGVILTKVLREKNGITNDVKEIAKENCKNFPDRRNHENLIGILYARSEYAEVVDFAGKYIDDGNEFSELIVKLKIQSLMHLHDLINAESYTRAAIRKMPLSCVFFGLLSRILMMKNELINAAYYAQTSILLGGGVISSCLYAQILIKMKLFKEAKKVLYLCVQNSDEGVYESAYGLLGEILRKEKKYQASLILLKKTLPDDNPHRLICEAYCNMHLGRLDDAFSCLNKAKKVMSLDNQTKRHSYFIRLNACYIFILQESKKNSYRINAFVMKKVNDAMIFLENVDPVTLGFFQRDDYYSALGIIHSQMKEA